MLDGAAGGGGEDKGGQILGPFLFIVIVVAHRQQPGFG